MENNPNSDQNPEQLMSSDHKKSSSDDHHDRYYGYGQSTTILGQSSARSYECSFCKRGFTNAQALGGHMNIHRKDKAKLKQLANFSAHETKQQQQQQSSAIIPNSTAIFNHQSPNSSPSDVDLIPSDRIDDHDGNYIVTTTTSWFLNQEPNQDHDHDKNRDLLSSDDQPGLDLELRLGPEPPPEDSSSTSVATRKFF